MLLKLRAQAVVMLAATSIACAPEGGEDAEGGGSMDPPSDLETPEFLEPANDELTIRLDRTTELALGVSEIEPGLTRIVVDDRGGSGVGEQRQGVALSTSQLTIQLHGAMIPADHMMYLQTQAGEEEALLSPSVLLRVQMVDVPALEASRDPTVITEADTLDAQGHGEEGLLYALDLQGEVAVVTLFPADDTGWDTGALAEIELPDFSAIESPRHAISATLHTTANDDLRARVAWRAGLQGERILGIDASWPLSIVAVQGAIELSDVLDDSIEYGTLGRPVWLGNTLVAEALLATDVESAHPGDRTLLTARLQGEPGSFGPTLRSSIGGGRDIDLIAPATDLLTHATGGVPGLAARAAGLRPVVIEVDASTGTLSERPTLANDRFSILHDATGPLLTVLGALESRQVFTPLGGPEPRVFLQHLGDFVGGSATNAAPRGAQLDMLGDLSGPVVEAVIAGLPMYLGPRGVDTPVIAIVSAATTPSVRPLDGLACDEIAVPRTSASADARALSVACLRGREVSIGQVTVEDPS